MARETLCHDLFVCPHSDEPWHEHAVELAIAIDVTPSKRVAALMREDLEELLQNKVGQGCGGDVVKPSPLTFPVP